jgi:hypothetical protein
MWGSQRGIFVLETWDDPTVVRAVDGERLLLNGHWLKRNPVRQVKALWKWLSDQLVETTGKRFPIRPVVLLPGWFVEVDAKTPPEVWVLNPKMLRAQMERGAVVLQPEEVALMASRIIKDMQTV